MELIEGVKIKKLKCIPDERGRLMEILRNDDELFIKFGQVYITAAYPGVVKAWHYHKKQTDHFVVLKGMMKVVLYDAREGSSTFGKINEFFMGESNHILLQIPNGVFHGFKCISEQEAMVLNIPTELYDYSQPDEYRIPPHGDDIPYSWERKDG
ncbi:dTDP-4-dehydrorhamnose 3,5-epimerase family protein [Petroclostridium sp. X23]|uniref:dTDP-4-dehydrorhamnose 3,5-epimerase family protein n=1 Tax=Petroclostridium sp. X23 TaxID=3045146 RepID=UPI0024ACACDB|nr:dTDP-4-dehydrorhamnose 3,5-epimerase family protein [Petroclostridium sp. X23]WHH58254.1 dTDP-4-dehydrorhamnose 3,5-epimerase family protein [Petroclostridium sp. X23]